MEVNGAQNKNIWTTLTFTVDKKNNNNNFKKKKNSEESRLERHEGG